MTLLWGAGAFFTVVSCKFLATPVSPGDWAPQGFCRNAAHGYLREPRGRAQQQAVKRGTPQHRWAADSVAGQRARFVLAALQFHKKEMGAEVNSSVSNFFSLVNNWRLFLWSCRGIPKPSASYSSEIRIRCWGILIAAHASRRLLCVMLLLRGAQ